MEFKKYLSVYCEAKEAEKAGATIDQDIKDYIDSRMADADSEGNVSGSRYNVIPSAAEGRLMVVDIDKGSVIGNIDPKGKLISVPVVYGDSVSFAVQDDSGRVHGTLRGLPDGNVINMFRVGEPSPGMKFKEVMGREDILPIEPTEEPDAEEEEGISPEEVSDKIKVLKDEVREKEAEFEDAKAEYEEVSAESGAQAATRASMLRLMTKDSEQALEKAKRELREIEGTTEDLHSQAHRPGYEAGAGDEAEAQGATGTKSISDIAAGVAPWSPGK